jgi:glycine/D-amino acid oxidase-like deaminating enzyme
LGRYDVVVAGGGFPGVCAAVAAARAGARVALLERDGTLGGQAAEIYTFGLDGFVDREGRLYAAGIPWEILRRTVAEGQSDSLWDRVDYERMAREGPGRAARFDVLLRSRRLRHVLDSFRAGPPCDV